MLSVDTSLPREAVWGSLKVIGASNDGGEVGLISRRGGLLEVLDGGVSKPLQVLHGVCIKTLVNGDFGVCLEYFC